MSVCMAGMLTDDPSSPMGREAVLSPVRWDKGEWPVFTQIRGVMNGWDLPSTNRDVPGIGHFNGDPDNIDFAPGTPIPPHFYFDRYPIMENYAVSSDAHPNTLRITPSRANLTGVLTQPLDPVLSGQNGISFLGRVQEHTIFSFSVDLDFDPREEEQEAGVTAFLTQLNHIRLGITRSPKEHRDHGSELRFRLRVETTGTTTNNTLPSYTESTQIPSAWSNGPIRLQIQSSNSTHFIFSAAPASDANASVMLGQVSAFAVSGGSGPFVGNVLGVYATCNGAGHGERCPEGGEAYFSNWRYSGAAQQIDYGRFATVT